MHVREGHQLSIVEGVIEGSDSFSGRSQFCLILLAGRPCSNSLSTLGESLKDLQS